MGVDGLLSVAHKVLSTENEYFSIFIDGVEDQVFSLQTEHLNDVVQTISSLLSKASTRLLGVRLLNKHLEQCSSEVFTRTGNLWTTLVLKTCQGQEDCAASYEALGKLALKSLQTPELTKTFATTHLTKVYESLVSSADSCTLAALHCMEICLRLYPSPSGPSKRSLDKFLSRFHDSLDLTVVLSVGKCLHLLQQVSGGEAQSSNHKMLWKNYQTQLVGSLHAVFDDMFVNCAEMWDDNKVPEGLASLDKLELSPDPINKAAQLYVRCRNLLNYLILALREPFPVEKPLMPRMILGVISRGLGVNCHIVHQNPISDNIALALLLPKIHLDLLHLLDVTISILRGHLLPHYNQVLGLLIDTMKSTANDEHYGSNQQPFRQLRAKVYDTLSLWCKEQSAGSRCEAIAEHLFQEILLDVTPKSNELTLQVTKAVSKHTSKKMKRQLQKTQNDRSKIAQSSIKACRTLKASNNDERNQMLCSAALRCLQAVLIFGGNLIKPTKIKLLQSSLIQICGNFYELPLDAAALYGNSNCRLEIYNTLYTILTTPHHLCPPPADILLGILNQACNRDGNLKVRGHCSWILQNLEKVVHPQKESLVFPIDAREIRNAFIMMGQEKLLANGDNGQASECLYEEQTEEEREEIFENNLHNHVEENKQNSLEPKNVAENNVVIISVENLNNSDLSKPANGEQDRESPQLISDSESSVDTLRSSNIDVISTEGCLKLRVDDGSDSDEVEVVSLEPMNKKPRIGDIIDITDKTQIAEDIIIVETKNIDSAERSDDSSSPEVAEAHIASAEDTFMDMDEDALVDDIASQFVDDLA